MEVIIYSWQDIRIQKLTNCLSVHLSVCLFVQLSICFCLRVYCCVPCHWQFTAVSPVIDSLLLCPLSFTVYCCAPCHLQFTAVSPVIDSLLLCPLSLTVYCCAPCHWHITSQSGPLSLLHPVSQVTSHFSTPVSQATVGLTVISNKFFLYFYQI